jgi:peptidoglycan/xylan/chitin deacetylase (PgdA/CDA1 family)
MKHEILDYARVREYLARRRFLCRVATGEKRVALTFDDGPHPVHTAEILEMCARKKIRATFFVVGRQVRRFPEIAARIAAEGHEIGNHTDRHIPLSVLTPSMIRRELAVAHELVVRAAGVEPVFFRPPMGWFNDIVVREVMKMGYRPVIGSIHPHDSRRPGAGEIAEHVLSRIEPGAIVILHDGGSMRGADRSQTVRAADRITSELLDQGYRFETLSGLTGKAGGSAAIRERTGAETDSVPGRT